MPDPMPSSSGSEFSASYDRTTKIISAAVCVLFVGLAVTIRNPLGGYVGALILAVSYAFSPRRYIVLDRFVIVKRLIGSVRIPLDYLREIREAGREDFRGCIRIFANGGLFGYYGLYRTSKLGECTWHVTRRSNGVILITGPKTVVFSPDDVKGFIGAIQAVSSPEALKSGADSCSGQFRHSSGWVKFGIAILVMLLLAVPPLLYSPGPPKYTITPEGLTIHAWLWSITVRAADVDVDHIQVVNIDKGSRWDPAERTDGIGLPHYHAGRFRVAGGERVRMYRADSKRLVLLPPVAGTDPVLVEVRQPEAFIQELRQTWR